MGWGLNHRGPTRSLCRACSVSPHPPSPMPSPTQQGQKEMAAWPRPFPVACKSATRSGLRTYQRWPHFASPGRLHCSRTADFALATTRVPNENRRRPWVAGPLNQGKVPVNDILNTLAILFADNPPAAARDGLGKARGAGSLLNSPILPMFIVFGAMWYFFLHLPTEAEAGTPRRQCGRSNDVAPWPASSASSPTSAKSRIRRKSLCGWMKRPREKPRDPQFGRPGPG